MWNLLIVPFFVTVGYVRDIVRCVLEFDNTLRLNTKKIKLLKYIEKGGDLTWPLKTLYRSYSPSGKVS